MAVYFLVGIVLAFVVTFAFGYLLERGLIRFLYRRPLDTLLATWGLSLMLQQALSHRLRPQRGQRPDRELAGGRLEGVGRASSCPSAGSSSSG